MVAVGVVKLGVVAIAATNVNVETGRALHEVQLQSGTPPRIGQVSGERTRPWLSQPVVDSQVPSRVANRTANPSGSLMVKSRKP